MNRRYRLFFGHPAAKGKVKADDWTELTYQFTPNIPSNVLEEAQTAAQLSGIVSQETQLKILSVVDNVKEEIERMDGENVSAMAEAERQMFALNEVTADDEQGVLE